jgi:diguanylate cyclase (GGDEF)-like protein
MPRARPWRLPLRSLVLYLAVLTSVLAAGLVLVEQGIRRQVQGELDQALDAGQRAAGLLWSAQMTGLPIAERLRALQSMADTQAVLLQAAPLAAGRARGTAASASAAPTTASSSPSPSPATSPSAPWTVVATTAPPALARDVARWRTEPAAVPAEDGLVHLAGDRHAVRIVALPQAGQAGDGGARSLVLLRSAREVSAGHDALRWTLFGLLFLALAVLAGGAAWMTRRIVRPLQALAQSVQRLGSGDYSTPVPMGDANALGELAQAVEGMRLGVMHRESEIRRLAFRDALTGLPNREQFRADVRQAIEQAVASGQPCTVLMLDLDRFKHVNDVLGPRLGDRLLQLVAQRLRDAVLLPDHRLARLGGDEFAVLLPATDPAGGLVVAQRILKSCERPISLYDHTVDLGAGIGIASAPAHGRDVDELLSHAEVAMYAAKHQQAGTVTYHPGLDSSSQESLTLQGELRQAVDQGQLQIWLQPKVSLATGQVIGAEALLRWQHPQRGLVPPMRFIPFAEQTGFVRVLTSWMIERTAVTWRALRAQGLNLKLSVNLSTRDLMDQDLPDKVARLLAAHAVEPGALCLEITESAIMDDPQRALTTLERLHAMGLRLSIDDFGTGYSSLAYLKRLPVDELKIDKSFVMNMESDLSDAKIVRSTVDLAHNLGLLVVAEGVENAKAWKLLSGLRCDEAQGHFIARAMPVDTFVQWARLWAPPHTADERLGTEFAAML